MIHKNLSVVALNTAQHMNTCGYWYLVQGYGCSPHTAFRTLQGLERWLDERGLKCEIPTAVQPEDYGKDTTNWSKIEGEYATEMHWSMDEFYGLPNIVVRSKTLSNGDYVEAIITLDGSIRTVHTLNPNVRGRKTFDYHESSKGMS